MKSPVTRDKYQKRLNNFFDFLGLEGDKIEQKSRVFLDLARKSSNQTFNCFLKFIQFQNSSIKKEISGATVRNYVKSIKLFCDISDCLFHGRRLHVGFQEEGRTPMTEFRQFKN
jgi:hypothetical protein